MRLHQLKAGAECWLGVILLCSCGGVEPTALHATGRATGAAATGAATLGTPGPGTTTGGPINTTGSPVPTTTGGPINTTGGPSIPGGSGLPGGTGGYTPRPLAYAVWTGESLTLSSTPTACGAARGEVRLAAQAHAPSGDGYIVSSSDGWAGTVALPADGSAGAYTLQDPAGQAFSGTLDVLFCDR